MRKTLVTVLEEFQTLNIILDRINGGSCEVRAPRFVKRLLKALSASDCQTQDLISHRAHVRDSVGCRTHGWHEEEAHVSGDYRDGIKK